MDIAAILRELDESDAIAAAATPGPWVGDRYDGSIKYKLYGQDATVVLTVNHKDMDYGFLGPRATEDELFVRHARDVLPARNAQLREAIAEIERLCEELEYAWENADGG